MASNEVLILHVDASKKSDNECLCTGENRAATRRRKERKDKVSSPGPEVSIVSIEKAKPKRKKLNRSCPKSVTLLLSSEDEDEIEMMEVDSKAEKPTTKTSNSSNKSRTSTQTDSLLTSSSSPSTSSGSSSIGSQQAGTSKSTTDDGASTSSTKSNKRQLESDYLAALRLSRTLNSKSLKSSGIDGDKNDVVLADAALAKTLQEKEYGILNPKRDVTFVMESRVVMPGASPSSLLPSTSSSSNTPISPDTVHPPNEVVPTPLNQTTENRQKLNPLLRKHPTCWTECPNCPPDAIRKYHLISVTRGAPEWDVIAQPVIEAGFVVMLLRRIQNDTLWQRLCFEKQLMLRERSDVNEKFLYHTTRSQVSVICEEGLDQRLSRSVGNFGTGIYFSDDPAKCDQYSVNTSYCGWKTMFCCRVLLGHTKIYPPGTTDGALLREPLKEHPLPGEPKTYDSVKGNLSGRNEFVVYNMYRVMPEYVIEYTDRNPRTTTLNCYSKLPIKKTTRRKRKKY